ncbi:MAG: hypothetical protein JJU11_07565 [Candidatus Sumerlaeia bacterium]|nr:hypothetical protein [Candidatus Sumerlaeia bacterium]
MKHVIGPHLKWIGLLAGLAAVVLAPMWLGSGEDVPIHSRFQWDTHGYHYPMLMYLSDAWRHGGEIPLWNPFEFAGNPIYADPQTQLWSPVTWFVLLTTGYSMLVLQAQLLATILLLGIGVYFTGCVIRLPRWAAWIAAASMMLGGYVTGHGSHFGTLSSLAWFSLVLPTTWLAVTDRKSRWRWAGLSGMLLGISATSGHPTTALIAAYQVGFLVFFLRGCPSLRWPTRLALLGTIGLISFMVSAPQVFGVIWGQGVMERIGPGTYSLEESANLNHLAMRSLAVNALLPGMALLNRAGMPNISHWQGFHANDMTMTTVYIGLGCLVGMAAFLLSGRRFRRRESMLAWLMAINLVLAAGMAFSPRIVAYFFLPGLNAPHHAAMDFRGFAMIAAVLLGARGLVSLVALIRLGGKVRRHTLLALGALPAALILIAIPCLIMGASQFQPNPDRAWVLTRSGMIPPILYLGEELLIQAVLAGGLLLGLVLCRRKTGCRILLVLCAFVAVDMSSAFLRTLPAFAERMTPGKWGEELRFERERPRPFEPRQLSVISTMDGNRPYIRREVAPRAYNPAQPAILQEHPDWIETITANPGRLLLPEGFEAEIRRITPNSVTLITRENEWGTVTLLKTWTPGWVVINEALNKEIAIPPPGEGPFMTFPLPPHQMEVTLRFQPGGFRISLMLLFVGYGLAFLLIALGNRIPLFLKGSKRGITP